MIKIWKIALREFQKTVMTKAFIIGTFVFPLVAWIAFPVIISLTQEVIPPVDGKVALIDPTGNVFPEAVYMFDPQREIEKEEAKIKARTELTEGITDDPAQVISGIENAAVLGEEIVPVKIALEEFPADADVELLKSKVNEGEFLAVAVLSENVLDAAAGEEDAPAIELFFSNETRHQHVRIIREKLAESVIRARAVKFGEDVEIVRGLLKWPEFVSVGINESGEETSDNTAFQLLLPIFFMMLIFMSVMTSGQHVLSGTVEEKSSRVIEVLLSAVSPMQLLTGRIIGQGMVSLIVIVMYGGLGFAALLAFAALDLVQPLSLVFFALFFVIAFITLNSFMAAIGSLVNDMTEAQTMMMPVMMFFVLGPMLLIMPVTQDPNGMVALITSFTPPLIPFVMTLRIPSGDIPAWQILLSLVLGYASAFGAIWISAKIFRIGILMRGKPPTLREIWKMVK